MPHLTESSSISLPINSEIEISKTNIIAIANQKGGVGKTTTTINLASSLANIGYKSLIIDMDPQGNSSSGLGLFCGPDEDTIYHGLLGMVDDPSTLIRNTNIENLKVIPANTQLIGAEVELVSEIAREKKLDTFLDQIKNQFDYIIIDCPPSVGLLTVNCLTAAENVLVPLQCEYYALEGLSHLLKTIDLVKASLNNKLSLFGILLTMFDSRNNLSHQVVDEVRKAFGDIVFTTIIPRNVRLSEAPSHGEPALVYDEKSRGAQSYLNLAEEVLRRDGYSLKQNSNIKSSQ